MRYGYRNSATIVALAAAALQSAGFLLATALISHEGLNAFLLSRPSVTAHSWWLVYKDVQPGLNYYIWDTGGVMLFLLICFVAGIFLRKIYQRTASAEVFFAIFFLCSITFEALRIWNAYLILKGVSISICVIVTRFTYFGRIFGLVCLLFSSLYAIRIHFQGFGVLLLSALFLSFAFAYVLPIDRALIMSNFLYKLGDERSLWLLTLILKIAIFLNFLIAAAKRHDFSFVVSAFAALLILSGREFLLYHGPVLRLGVGLCIAVTGIWIFGRQMTKIYLWPNE